MPPTKLSFLKRYVISLKRVFKIIEVSEHFKQKH